MDISNALGVMTGERYRASLDDGREVWLAGERVANVAEHPAFRGVVDEFARLFDLRIESEADRELNTFLSPETGNPVSRSYALPRTREELRAKFAASEWWMRESLGQLGRSPDFMANVVVGLYDYHEELEREREGFGANAVNYHRYAMEHDLVLTHALGDPQIDRSASPLDDPDLALRVVEKNERGVVIRGAKQLATLAPFSHEVLVYLNAVTAMRGAEEFVLWFALPMNAKGLKILCREPLGERGNGHSHPLGRRFDEQDAMLFFDDVEIPWERLFLLENNLLAVKGLSRLNAWSMQSTHIRFHERLRLFVSVAAMLAESIGVNAFRGIQENVGELISYAETLRLGIAGAEASAVTTPGGLLAPAPSYGLGFWSADVSARVVELVRRIGASGLIMQPTEADLAAPELRPFLEKYMRGHDIDVDRKARLFRVAWELVGDGFGSRQELYEYLHRGDPGAGRTRLLRTYDRSEVDARLTELISAPLHA
ncbi:4-hydroxyphenylacetate 3-monooxygenase oxygenase component [Sphaerisporangium krabiense]|uniref:4-hydroxyphenylacetate 3-monooxygenase oxygenase component n=1 Tax=Sphaerisporangium krabiense TaxID=763782 RepID=A0A7W9DRC0_9ACTN|nr:4-hydroxyphenylacetate 3-hydroxylase N-terminal domain-containing protein [Sphaerisporangium krabiense]MBB5627939.1 4-hydroxyphenylacetate 3-monooxygenase oxygenase component [Sphaerisporangium krabiense]GII62099.1 4-hydroxyphenylacetate 3-monooxygenase oxygenase component [Sphaerisporangium krabiense]